MTPRERLKWADLGLVPEDDSKFAIKSPKIPKPTLSALDLSFPDVAVPQASLPLSMPVENAVPVSEVAVSTAKFDRLTDKALDVLDECMDDRNDDTGHIRLMNLRMQAAQTVISSRIKVDDSLLRRQQHDILPKIIELMKAEDENLRLIEAEAE
jgi:hypothetical protein